MNIFKFFERKKLVKKGLACGKTRRKQSRNEVLQTLEKSYGVKWSLLLLFMVGLAFLIFSGNQPEVTKSVLIGFLILVTAVTQLWLTQKEDFRSNPRILLIFGTIFLQLLLVKLSLVLHAKEIVRADFLPFLFPMAFAPLILSVLLGKYHGLFAAVFGSLLATILMENTNAVFLVMSLISGFTAVFLTLQVRRRNKLISAGFFVGLVTCVLGFAFGLIGPFVPTSLGAIDWVTVGGQVVTALANGLLTGMLVGGVLPAFESLFKITTDISWLEMADLNHPLLTRLMREAPGTYQHSFAVANLAQAAAEAVGANPTICQVGAYFHDIGKLVKPNYFTENMQEGENPHNDLTPTMSALIIIAHVKEGVDLAIKHRLNREIIDIIQQHHGTSLVGYFYRRAVQQQEDAKIGGKIMNIREEDIPEVKKESFRYPGPRPQTKEAAIISLADCVESASRSLQRPTPQKIEQLIKDLFKEKVENQQLDKSPLTIKDLRIIEEKFKATLLSMKHTRVAYTKEEDEPATTIAPSTAGEESGSASA